MENRDLASPLLSSTPSNQPEVILNIQDNSDDSGSDQPCNGINGNYSVSAQLDRPNPYEFLESTGFSVPGSSTLDPFRNLTPDVDGVYEVLKILICLPIALLRLVLLGVCLAVGFIATKLALWGWKDRNNPMPKWRCVIMLATRFSARCILFSFGYQWIRRKGKPAPREIAPIVVSNHVSYIEPIFYFYELSPTIVAAESHDSIPFVGTIIRAMQVIYVNRFSQSSRKHAVNEIKRKAACDKFPRVLLFPEGTTTNGKVLISFQLGAFIPGYPIQPVVVRYPCVHFDQSWGHISLVKLMLRMFTQFHNFMEVEYLPVIYPRDNQKESATQFSERTSRALAGALNVVQTSHSYGDLMLRVKASELKLENPASYMVEMASVESLFHLSNTDALDLLDSFMSMEPDTSGCVTLLNFLRVQRLKDCNLSQEAGLSFGSDISVEHMTVGELGFDFTEGARLTIGELVTINNSTELLGYVNKNEYHKYFQGGSMIFRFIDVEKSGSITFKQFLFASAHVMKQPSFPHACEEAFSECAVGGRDYISVQEFGDAIRHAIPTMSENEVHNLFDLFDKEKHRRINRNDFVTCLKKNPLLITLFSPILVRNNFTGANTTILEEMV